MNLKAIFTAWNLSKELPKIAVCVLLGAALMLPLVCGKKTYVYNTVYRDTALAKVDSLIVLIKQPSAPIVVKEIITRTVDSVHDCWNSLYTLIGPDTLSIESINSCKGLFRGVRLAKGPDSVRSSLIDSLRSALIDIPIPGPSMPETDYKSPFGYRVDAQFGASLFGGTVFAANARAWFGRWGLFVNPRLVLPAIEKSSFDGGVSYQLF